MNGRVYDPAIAMFLSPDNYIQDPTNSQNYNRYTYCLNNPLIYTDPSGYMTWKGILGTIGINIVGIGTGIATFAFSGGTNCHGFVGYWDDETGDWKISGGGYGAGVTYGYEFGVVNDQFEVYGQGVFDVDFESWFNQPNSSPVSYDPGAKYNDLITGQEYYANSGSETFDNSLANGGYYNNPGDMNLKKSYDIYIGSNYQTGFSPYSDNLMCTFQTCEYIGSIYGSDNTYGHYLQNYENIGSVLLGTFDGATHEEFKNMLNLHFKTGRESNNPTDIFRNINVDLPRKTEP